MCCRVLQVCCSLLQYVTVCCSVLQCVVKCCKVLQCVAVCCSVLPYVAVYIAVQNARVRWLTRIASPPFCGWLKEASSSNAFSSREKLDDLLSCSLFMHSCVALSRLPLPLPPASTPPLPPPLPPSLAPLPPPPRRARRCLPPPRPD